MSGLVTKNKPPVIILAGGMGTRLRALDSSRPKPMVLVRGKPFLHWLVDHLRGEGFKDYILSTGYMAEIVETYPWTTEFPRTHFKMYRETSPLGTGGAVQAIFREYADMGEAWIVNGDTLLSEAFPEIPADADAFYTTLTAGQVFDAKPNLLIDGDFVVAESASGQYFDAGAVWVTRRAIEKYAGDFPFSLHRVLGNAMAARRVKWAAIGGTCYDIGTPERFRRFEAYLGGR
jgi:NDP-sugar pyrophosphorylase family protein